MDGALSFRKDLLVTSSGFPLSNDAGQVHPQVARFWDNVNNGPRLQQTLAEGGNLTQALEKVARHLCSEQTVWHIGGDSPLSGNYEGIAGVVRLFTGVAELSERPIVVETLDVIGNENLIAAYVHERGQRKGKTLDALEVHFHRVDADGKFLEFWDLPFDQNAVDEFWNA